MPACLGVSAAFRRATEAPSRCYRQPLPSPATSHLNRCPPASRLAQIRVGDGSRLRSIPCGGDFSHAVAWAPHAYLLAFAAEDANAAKPDVGAVRLVAAV
jgi:hypothetical protein